MMYIFKSSCKSDNARVTVLANDKVRAVQLVTINFIKNGYKGRPVLAI